MKKNNKINIRGIAKIANVSTATVSRVLNTPEKVSDETRDLILSIIDKYEYNKPIKRASKSHVKIIAFFVEDILNPFYTKLIKEINNIAFEYDFLMVLCETGQKNSDTELDYIKKIKDVSISGVILTDAASIENIKNIPHSIPCVIIDRKIKGYPLVSSDNYTGACLAMEYLLRLNHKKIAFAGTTEVFYGNSLRKKGYLDTLEKNKIDINADYIFERNKSNIDLGVEAAEYFLSLKTPPTAIFASNDEIAQGIIERLTSLDIKVPDYFSVIGFDGVLKSNMYELTTINQNISQIASSIVNTLFNIIKKDEFEENILIPVKLKIGNTCKKI